MQRLYTEFDDRINEKGFVRQHIAKDATSLFRCIAQQVYQSQSYYTVVKKEFIEYLLQNGHEINFCGLSVEEYVSNVSSDGYYGTFTDALILLKMYEINTYIWTMDDYTLEACGHQFNCCNCLILAYDESCGQFDVVVTKEEEKLMASVQSMIYETAFKVFFPTNSDELQTTVKQMLNDKHFAQLKKEKKLLAKRTESEVNYEETDLPPISYSMAKCLNANVYRNEVFHNWMKANQQAFHNFIKLMTPLTRGMRVVYDDGNRQSLDGYVQRIDDKMVLVYVVPLMQRLWFHRSQLKPAAYAKSEEQKESRRRRFRQNNSSSTLSSGNGDNRHPLSSNTCRAVALPQTPMYPAFIGTSPTFHFQSQFAFNLANSSSQIFLLNDVFNAYNGQLHSDMYFRQQ